MQSPGDLHPLDPTASNSDIDMINVESSSSSDMGVIPSTPPGKEEQLSIVKTEMLATLQVGRIVYLFPSKWFDAFVNWARGTGGQPSSVDPLAVLCDRDGVLLESAQEGRDYQIISQEGWALIRRWSLPSPQLPPNMVFHWSLVDW